MKGIYIHNGSKTRFSGVDKKIKNQIKVFSEHFDMSEVIIEKKETTPLKSIMWRLPGGSWGAKYECAIEEIYSIIENIEENVFFYIRIGLLDRKYVSFISNLREHFPKALILLEIPTYPYSNELLQSKTMWPWYFKDIVNNRKISKYLDKVVTYSEENRIFNLDTIKISNGIIVGNPPCHDCVELNDFREINVLAVAQFQKSHGYERIIEGLARYYSVPRTQSVIMHMVGDGEESQYYKTLTAKSKLEDKIIFYGMQHGENLERLYQKADLGLGCFGLYKRNIKTISSLKTAEYLSHGLPIITGVKENILENLEQDFYCEFPNDNSVVNIEDIVAFYTNLRNKFSRKELETYLYNYSKKTVDMSVTMRPVIDYLIIKDKNENNTD